jgi:hypothetical protein
MVSSVLDMSEAELLATLGRLSVDCAADAEYAQLRAALPDDWPL